MLVKINAEVRTFDLTRPAWHDPDWGAQFEVKGKRYRISKDGAISERQLTGCKWTQIIT